LIEEGVVIKEGHIYILEGKLKGKVVYLHHDIPVGGHGGK